MNTHDNHVETTLQIITLIADGYRKRGLVDLAFIMDDTHQTLAQTYIEMKFAESDNYVPAYTREAG